MLHEVTAKFCTNIQAKGILGSLCEKLFLFSGSVGLIGVLILKQQIQEETKKREKIDTLFETKKSAIPKTQFAS